MPYRFKHSQNIPENVKRIASEEITSAVGYLRGKRGVSGEDSVHEVRKNIKKTRALLRLVRPEMGKSFLAENTVLRDTGRELSELRDAGALIVALDALRKRPHHAPRAEPASVVRRMLVTDQQRLEQEAGTSRLMHTLITKLSRFRQAIRRLPLKVDGFAAIEAGLEQTFRDGRRALARARKSGSREDFHEWRKRVKDHWYQVRLLEKLWGDVMEAYEHSLKELEDFLGEDLNLAILRERVQAMVSANGHGPSMVTVIHAIDTSRKELRERSLALGEKIYAEKPRHFAKQMGRLWKTWRRNAA